MLTNRQLALFIGAYLLSASGSSSASPSPFQVCAFSAPPPPSGGSPKAGIRLNKVFKRTHSRREADALLTSGRVEVNGRKVEEKGGFLVVPYVDEVRLDGEVVEGWEEMNGIPRPEKDTVGHDKPGKKSAKDTARHIKLAQHVSTEQFQYVKYWKPRGITCTTDRKIPSNIIDAIISDGYRPRHRIYPVGRLDKDTSGLILLTSDGRLPNAALRTKNKQPKVYEAVVDRPIRESDLRRWREGVVITTDVARNGKHRSVTAKTLPCDAQLLDRNCVQLTLVEGRNRQVRKMTVALDYTTVELMRVEFMGIGLSPQLKGPGDWAVLGDEEMDLVREVLGNAVEEQGGRAH